MRVTENSISANFLTTINRTRERLAKLQTQLASGKRVQTVSDDPQATDSILRLRATLAKNEEFKQNVIDGLAMTEMTASALDSFAGVLIQLKELATQARNGSRHEALSNYGDRVDQLLGEAVNIANTKFNGKFLFGGTQTMKEPFILASDRSSVSVNPDGITGAIEYPVAESFALPVNIDGEEAFQGTTIFTMMIQLRDDMKNGSFPTAAQIDAIDDALDHVLSKTSKAGAMHQSLSTVELQLEERGVRLLSLLSERQDTDVAEAILKLKHDEIMLEAALNTAARVIPKSLLDFLK